MNNLYPRIKICGIKDAPTALTAVHAGADAIGMVFAPGKRKVTPEQAREICSVLPPFVFKVGVFVNSPADEIKDVADYTGLDAIQLHGDEAPEMCAMFRQKVIKAFRVGSVLNIEEIERYPADAFLFDTLVDGQRGGTGKTFNWSLVNRKFSRPVILAGGLHPGNIREAIATVRPFAVDVSSGVETDGVKDPHKIIKFIKQVSQGTVP